MLFAQDQWNTNVSAFLSKGKIFDFTPKTIHEIMVFGLQTLVFKLPIIFASSPCHLLCQFPQFSLPIITSFILELSQT